MIPLGVLMLFLSSKVRVRMEFSPTMMAGRTLSPSFFRWMFLMTMWQVELGMVRMVNGTPPGQPLPSMTRLPRLMTTSEKVSGSISESFRKDSWVTVNIPSSSFFL